VLGEGKEVEEIDCPVCKLNLSIETMATHWCGKPTWTRDEL
jgi:hypothetical protein